MKTRFSSLVTFKKNEMEHCEELVQKANKDLDNTTLALEKSYTILKDIQTPSLGDGFDLLASRTLIGSARDAINHNRARVKFLQNQLLEAQAELKVKMIEYEKFKYLEVDEVKKIIKQRKYQEAKDLDEVALMTYNIKGH